MRKIARGGPPFPRLVFRVGVTGHRWIVPERLPALRSTVHRLLAHIRREVAAIGARLAEACPDAYDQPLDPVLVIVSPLAKGADALVADEAVALGYVLDVPLPFDITRLDPHFDPLAARLYGQARARLLLDGIRGDPQAYVEVGRRVVDHSDLLIAIWDAESAGGLGGTAWVIELALGKDTPVVHLPATEPEQVAFSSDGRWTHHDGVEGVFPDIERLIGLVLEPPRPWGPESNANHRAPDLRSQYFRERPLRGLRRWFLGKPYGVVTKLLSLHPRSGFRPTRAWFRPLSHRFEGTAREAWMRDFAEAKLSQPMIEQLDAKLLRHFAWANGLAIIYAIRYRSTILWTYALAFAAVFSAVFGHLELWGRAGLWHVLEVVALSIILVLFGRGTLGRVHEKWMDYRSLAERIRHLAFLLPLGQTSPALRVPARADDHDPRYNWLNWIFRAIVREAGLFDGSMTRAPAPTSEPASASDPSPSPPYLEQCRRLLLERILKPQQKYHADVSEERHRLHRRLEPLTFIFFLGALAAAFQAMLAGLTDESLGHHPVLFALAVLLPTAGAAIHGFLSQAAFRAVAQRSAELARQLGQLGEEVATLSLASIDDRVTTAHQRRYEELSQLSGDSLRSRALRPIFERLDPRKDPVVAAAIPDLQTRSDDWRCRIESLKDAEILALLEQRPLRVYPSAASAVLGRCAQRAAELMGEELAGWRADSEDKPLVLA